MESVLGAEGSLIVRFVVAFVIVLALIGFTFWLIRRFGGARVGTSAQRGRQPRLAVIDAVPVDGRRRLVLVRRDNVEHLMMIGGPSDVVVEQNIVRAVPVNAPRDVPMPRPAAPESQRPPEPSRPQPVDEESWTPPEPSPPPPRSFRPEPPPRPEPPTRAPRPSMDSPRPVMDSPRPMMDTPRPPLPASIAPPPIVPSAEPPELIPAPPPAQDAALANMAQRLEAALRRPNPPPADRPAPARPSPEAPAIERALLERPAPAPAAPPAPARVLDPAPPAAEPTPPTAPDAPAAAKPADAAQSAAKSKSVLDSLEEEMASLLGRPPEKT